jgi:hypothetical protein
MAGEHNHRAEKSAHGPEVSSLSGGWGCVKDEGTGTSHPSDEGLSPGTPEGIRERETEGISSRNSQPEGVH